MFKVQKETVSQKPLRTDDVLLQLVDAVAWETGFSMATAQVLWVSAPASSLITHACANSASRKAFMSWHCAEKATSQFLLTVISAQVEYFRSRADYAISQSDADFRTTVNSSPNPSDG